MNPSSLEPTRFHRLRRQLVFAALVVTSILLLAWRSLLILQVNGWNPLKAVIFFLFLVLLVPIALSFWTSLVGFLLQWRGGDKLDIARNLGASPSQINQLHRTAVIMPIYNEDPARVFAGLRATYKSLSKTGALAHFDFFILSDTTHPDIWVREEMAFAEMRSCLADPHRLFYRNRRENVDRKTGNIADFCESWGGHYSYMIVLDADSIMSGTSMVNLVRLMEKDPETGMIQAPPLPVNRDSLFGRLHQFAMHAYGPIFTSGLNFWQGDAANYWGHNAIIRVRPFVEHCRLPTLPGKQPLGGPILSHDFVEAALMRRAGWKVYLATELGGSYEEIPSSLIGYAARDRRWCQGNLQHARLLLTPKFHLVNRIHMALGTMSYLASPLWLLLLALSTIEALRENLGAQPYFLEPALFPNWHISVEQQAVLMLSFILSLLLLPKALAFLLALRQQHRLASFGGACRLALSMLAETLVSTLLAPNIALLQSRFVIATLMGRNVKWNCQDRGETSTSFREGVHLLWPATLLGALWAVLLALTIPRLLLWFSPAIAGFLLAIPLSVWTSRSTLGQEARKCGLFIIPEESSPPPILLDLQHMFEQSPRPAWADNIDGLDRVLLDPAIRELHLSLLPREVRKGDLLQSHHLQGLQLKYRQGGSTALSAPEKRELLLARDSIASLREESDSAPLTQVA